MSRCWLCTISGLVGLAILGLAAAVALGLRPEFLENAASANSQEFRPERLIAPHAPITTLNVVTADQVQGRVSDDESVIGLVVGDTARAYPVEMVKSIEREVLNDAIAGYPVLITWCGRCQAARVFEREFDGRPLTFFVPGLLWNDNMVVEDQETGTQWSQLLGRAMRGPLTGRELTPIPAVVTNWKTWRADHPRSEVVLFERLEDVIVDHKQRYPEESGDAFVIAIRIGGETHAWTFDGLRDAPCRNETVAGKPILVQFDMENDTAQIFRRDLGDRVLTFVGVENELRDDQTGTFWDRTSGAALRGPLAGSSLSPLPATISWREKWLRFYPDTHVHGREPTQSVAAGSAAM